MASYKSRSVDEQKDADSMVSKAMSCVVNYHQATAQVREQVVEDFKFNDGGLGQWDPKDVEKLKSENRPILTFNLTAPVVNFIAGYQAEREQDWRAFPRGTEDEHLGRISTALMRYASDTAKAPHTMHLGFRKGIIGGQSVFEVSHSYDLTDDYVEGDVRVELLEYNTWGCEIGARRYDRNDAQHQFKLSWWTKEDAQRQWPQHAARIASGIGARDWVQEDARLTGVPQSMMEMFVDKDHDRVRVCQYWYRVPTEVTLLVNLKTGDVQRMPSEKAAEQHIRRIYDTAGASVAMNFAIEKSKSQSALVHKATGQYQAFRRPEQAEQMLAQIRKQAGQQAADTFDLVTRKTTSLRVAHLLAWEMLDDKPSPYGSDWRFPFAVFTCYQDTDDLNTVKGAVRDIKDPQREVNWHHSTIQDTLMRGPKGGVWLHKQENADIERIKREYSRAGFVGEYSGQPPVPVVPQILGTGDMEMLQFGIDAIMRIANVNAEMMGQTTQKTVSGRAIQSRQAGGIVGLGSLFMNWQMTKQYIGELLLRRIQQYYSPEKMDRVVGKEQRVLADLGLVGPQTIPNEVMYEMFKQIQSLDMDVVVGFQEASPTARAAVSAQMMQMRAAGAPIPLELIIETSDLPYKQEILARLKQQGEQPPDPNLAKVVAAGQGQSPNGVNKTA